MVGAHPLGDHTNPASRDALRAKAERLLAVRYGIEGAAHVGAAFDGYVGGGEVSEFGRVLR